jgi:hypothetical protein
MRVLLFFILFMSFSIKAMDQFVITIADAQAEARSKELQNRLRFAQEKDALFEQAESDIEKGLCAFMAGYMWLSKMFCMNGDLQPTMSDAYILGCTCSVGCTFCATACCNCCRAMMLKQE